MSDIIDAVVALTRAEARIAASAALALRLGGRDMMVFVRDREVDALLPAPGYPQTLPDARAWRRFLQACVDGGEARVDAVTLPGGETQPAFGFSSGRDIVAVVLGVRGDVANVANIDEVRQLLPFLEATIRGERAAAHAVAQTDLARQSAAHAEKLATALDGARAQLQRALGEAARAREELEHINVQLQDQAVELEAQAHEMEAQTEELQRANASLEVARREAEAANRAKSDFLATMSHELRTPLNAISGHVQLVQMGIHGSVTDAQREALTRIDRSQRHLLGLINNVLNLARIERGYVDYRQERVRLSAAIADIDAMIRPQLETKALRYEVQLADPELAVTADREKLQQVLLNLISNAVKFTPRGGSIRVEGLLLEEPPGMVAVRVTDTGIGIPAGRIADIFEPFVQVDSSHSREGQGTGLGLAISRDLARGMRGDLLVESVAGQGSTFELRLPSDPGPAGGERAERGAVEVVAEGQAP